MEQTSMYKPRSRGVGEEKQPWKTKLLRKNKSGERKSARIQIRRKQRRKNRERKNTTKDKRSGPERKKTTTEETPEVRRKTKPGRS